VSLNFSLHCGLATASIRRKNIYREDHQDADNNR
jgi:hypothetical protein